MLKNISKSLGLESTFTSVHGYIVVLGRTDDRTDMLCLCCTRFVPCSSPYIVVQ